MKVFVFILCCLLVGSSDLFSQNGKQLTVEFSEIDSLQYAVLSKAYICLNQLVVDSMKKSIPDSSFTLSINHEKQRFVCAKDYAPCYYYKGFLPVLGFYVITHCERYACQTLLIDQTTGVRHSLFSPFDSECEAPVLSKELDQMLVFASDVFDRASFISIYRRSSEDEDFKFETYSSLIVDNWKIHEAIWIDSQSFALKTFDEYGDQGADRLLNVRFIRAEIK